MKSRPLLAFTFLPALAAGTLFPPSSRAGLIEASPSGQETFRINCGELAGDPGYVDPAGNLWMRDEDYRFLNRWGFVWGSAASTTTAISGTTLQDVFRTHRFGFTDMAYRINLPNGTYRVKLLFAETFWNSPGQRVFDVALEGSVVLKDHDVLKEHAKFEADEHSFTVTVNDQSLDITFPAVAADNAFISGIEVSVLSVSDDAFLDFLQKGMFSFFWQEVDPVTGFIRDKAPNFGSGVIPPATLAPMGFGMSIYTVGVQRGWVTADEAAARIMKILNAFRLSGPGPKVEQYHGFWYHGLRTSDSENFTTDIYRHDSDFEVSTVDSALLVLGALQAGEYFRSTHPEIAAAAAEIYGAMEWDWFTGRPRPGSPLKDPPKLDRSPFISLAWNHDKTETFYFIPAPDGGFFSDDWWDRYSETVFIDLLAFSSPSHSIDAAAWAGMRRFWLEDLGYHLVQSFPLFTHQFQHLYYDLKNMDDGYTDYWENTRKATLYQRDYARNSGFFPHEDIWGMSNCMFPTMGGPSYAPKYGEYGVGEVDGRGTERRGTVAPTAAITSIEFAPAEVLRAARRMFFQYKHHVWGRYGFSDAFNVRNGFIALEAFGLENGSMILAIENFRTGMIRNTFMRNPLSRTGLARAGFAALGTKPLLSASSYEDPAGTTFFSANKAADGDPATRWASAFVNEAWISIDFGAPRLVNRLTVHWEAAYAVKYRIEWSADGNTWVQNKVVNDGHGGVEVVDMPATNTRFLRLVGTERALPAFGYSIVEMVPEYFLPPATPGASVNVTLNLVE